jgi:two-component system response regulator ChvI
VLEIDHDRKLVIYKGERLRLTSTQFDIVAYLSDRPEFVRSREQILMATRGHLGSLEVSPRTVDTEIKRIRRRLRDTFGRSDWIKTMYHEGYYWQN